MPYLPNGQRSQALASPLDADDPSHVIDTPRRRPLDVGHAQTDRDVVDGLRQRQNRLVPVPELVPGLPVELELQNPELPVAGAAASESAVGSSPGCGVYLQHNLK